MIITLPFPNPKLNPNRSGGRHWGVTSSIRESAKSAAWVLTLEQMGVNKKRFTGDVALDIMFVQPDRRNRDRDNLLAALKPSLDGIAAAMGINDSQFEPVTIRRGYGAKPGAVIVKVGV